MLATVDVDYWCADNGILSLWLHKTLQNLCGVDLSKLFVDEMSKEQACLWERWHRCPMGITTSLYQAVGAAMNFTIVLLGDQGDGLGERSFTAMGAQGEVRWQNRVDVHIYVDYGRSTAHD